MPLLHVLLVDDDPDDRAAVLGELAREFPDLRATEVGDEAAFQAALSGERPDLVITKSQTAWAAASDIFLKARQRWPEVPVILFITDGKAADNPSELRSLAVAARAAWESSRERQQALALERRYRLLVDTVPAVIYIAGPELRLRYVSPYVRQLLGFSPDELLDKSPSDLVPRDDRRDIVRRFRTALRTGAPFALEHRILAADGSERWVRNLGTVLKSPEFERPVIQGMVLDITDTVLANRRQMVVSEISQRIAELLPGEQLQGALAALRRHIPFAVGILGASPVGHLAHEPDEGEAATTILRAAAAVYGPGMQHIPPDSVLGLAYSLRAPVVQHDTHTRTYAEDAMLGAQGIRSVLAYPLILRDDVRAGLLLFASEPNAFGDFHLTALEQAGPVLSAGVESYLHWRALQELNAGLEARVQERTAQIQALYELSQRLGNSLRPDDLFAPVTEYLLAMGGVDAAAVALLQMQEGMPVVATHAQRPLTRTAALTLMEETGRQLGGWVANGANAGDLRHRIAADVKDSHAPPLEQLGDVLVEPVEAGGRRLGGLAIACEAQGALGDSHRQLLRAAAGLVSNTLQRIGALARAERTRLEEAIDAMGEGILLLDDRDRLVATNPAARRLLPMLGLPDLREGDVLRELCGFSLDDLRARTCESGPSECTVGETEPRVVAQLSAVSYTTPTGAIGTVLTLHDITEQRQAQIRMEQQARLAALGQLAGGIAHDFNNILTTLIGLAQLNLGAPDLSPQLRADLEQIVQQGQRAARLVQQILDFGRRSMSQKTSLHLDAILRDVIRPLRRTIPASVAIQTDFPPGDYTVFADGTQFQQLIMNLVSNSCEAMPEGGMLTFRLGRIATDAALLARYPMMKPGQYVHLQVADTGHGMPPEVLAHAFEPFFTTKGVGEGSGLGLAQAYGIVKQHEGYIFLDSQVGVGTQVHIYLPAQHEQAEQPAPRPSYQGEGRLVLVAEDEEMVRELMERMLGRLGYRAVLARNGAEALRIFQAHADQIFAVVADMLMPRVSGLELFDRLREINPSLPVILTTSYADSAGVERLRQQGLHGVLQKPFRMADLADLLQSIPAGPPQPTDEGNPPTTR